MRFLFTAFCYDPRSGGYDMLVSAYVDGFNFYEASKNKSWYPYGWCNWTKTIENYCPRAEVRVKYFTSDVSPRHRGSRARQDLHLRGERGKCGGVRTGVESFKQRDTE